MKKIITFIFLSVFCLYFVGCTDQNSTKNGQFTVNYDYGTIEENKITILIDSCLPFFDFEDYNIKQLYPGDVLYIDYKGNPIIAESYPGRMTGIEISHIEVFDRTIQEVSEEQIERNESNGISKVHDYSYTTEYVILNEELDYVPLNEYTGSSLYVSLGCLQESKSSSLTECEEPISITAFFAFNPNDEKSYKLSIYNYSDLGTTDIKDEYKAGEEVEVKMVYEEDIVTFVFLNGNLLGYLNGINSIKFNMPAKDSTLVITYTNNAIYRVSVIDNFDLLAVPIKEYYNAGDTVKIMIKFLSDSKIDVQVDGQFLDVKETKDFEYYEYEFIMSEKDVEIIILYNGYANKTCENDNHQWDEGVVDIFSSLSNPPIKYTCLLCGKTKKEPSELLEYIYEYQFHFFVEGGNGTINVETRENKCTFDCVGDLCIVKFNGGENKEITFVATPNIGYQVKEWVFNGEVVEGNKTNSYTVIVSSEDESSYDISVRFEEMVIVYKLMNEFLIGSNLNKVILSDGEGINRIEKSFTDFKSQSFFNKISQIEVTMIEENDYQTSGVDYYITFTDSFDGFVSLQFYGVNDLDSDKVSSVYYGRIKCFNTPFVSYHFAINKDLFYEIINYFINDTETTKLFYSLQESFDNGFLTHANLQQIANLRNRNPFNSIETNQTIATLIMKDFCKLHNVDFEENEGSVRFFGEYNGYYAVMVDGCGIMYLTALTSEIVDGITFSYGSSQHILVWKYHE